MGHARTATFTAKPRCAKRRWKNSPARRGTWWPWLTRNAHGCLVLNTARVMFIDLDFPPVFRRESLVLFTRLFNKSAPSPLSRRESAITERLEQFLGGHPHWGLRLYRTCAGLRPGDARAVRSGRRCHPCRAAIGGRRSLVRATLQGPAVLPCQIRARSRGDVGFERAAPVPLACGIPTSKRATRNGKRSTPQGRSPMQRAGFSGRLATAASIPRSPGSSKFTTSPAAAKRRWTWPDAGNASNGSGAETRVRPAS